MRVCREESVYGGRIGLAGSTGRSQTGDARVPSSGSQHCTFAGWARTICVLGHLPHSATILTSWRSRQWTACCPGRVAVVGTQKSVRNAPWGELLSTAARAEEHAARSSTDWCATYGRSRRLGFPVFASGIKPVDSMAEASSLRTTFRSNAAKCWSTPGRFCLRGFRWSRGCTARDRGEEVIGLAADKVQRENSSRRELMKGAYLRDVFSKFGVLCSAVRITNHRNDSGTGPDPAGVPNPRQPRLSSRIAVPHA